MSRTITGTRAEARGALQRLVVEAGCDLHGGSHATVAVLLTQTMATAQLAPTTRADWESLITHHLLPALGGIPIWRLTARHCDRVLHGRGRRRPRPLPGPLRPRRPPPGVRPSRPVGLAGPQPGVKRHPPRSPPHHHHTTRRHPGSRRVGHGQLEDPTLACWLKVAAATGARRGEVCGLRWSDIDLAEQPSASSGPSATRSSGLVIKATKTGRVRRVSITTQATDASSSTGPEPSWWQPTTTGSSIRPTSCSPATPPAGGRGGRAGHPTLGTPPYRRRHPRCVRIHDIRHIVATELLTAGIDVRTVANRLGHARTSTTMDIYWAFVPARDRDAADHLQRILE